MGNASSVLCELQRSIITLQENWLIGVVIIASSSQSVDVDSQFPCRVIGDQRF